MSVRTCQRVRYGGGGSARGRSDGFRVLGDRLTCPLIVGSDRDAVLVHSASRPGPGLVSGGGGAGSTRQLEQSDCNVRVWGRCHLSGGRGGAGQGGWGTGQRE